MGKFGYCAMRERKGATLEEAASAVGVSTRTLQSWEEGRTSPSALKIIELCRFYDCTAYELLSIGEQESALISFYRECTPQWKKNILDTAFCAVGMAARQPNIIHLNPSSYQHQG